MSGPDSRRRALLLAWSLLAAVPVVYILTHIVATSRNIVFWDEFDTALDLILRLDAGAGWREILQRLFAITNEHRTVTSRVMFAVSYWLTGTVNFHVIGAIGNLFFFGACFALVVTVTGWERRVRMGVVLAFMMFQLEHFESFIWSGASIDHFQVVTLAILAIAALARGGIGRAGFSPPSSGSAQPGRAEARPTFRSSFIVAVIFALLATFTLAQGNVVWVVGALLLAHGRRWRELVAWAFISVVAVAAFLHGFELNLGHGIREPSAKNIVHIGRYWLELLGAPLTLGEAKFAALPGVALLAAMGFLAWRDLPRREPVAWFSAWFGIGALALIALGRAELAGSMVNSRYLVLGALAWALVIFMLLELAAEAYPGRPFRHLAWALPGLIVFNVAANQKFAPMIDSFVEVRDRAATSFEQHGADGRGVAQFRLHPRDKHADILMKMAEDRGVYRLPVFSRPAKFPQAKASTQIITYFDEIMANERAVTLGGWAMRPGKTSRRGEIYVILRTATSQRIFSTVPLQRTDIAAYYQEPRWRFCGFRAVIRRDQLPSEDFEIGVLIANRNEPEFLMTGNRLELSGPEPRIIRAAAQ